MSKDEPTSTTGPATEAGQGNAGRRRKRVVQLLVVVLALVSVGAVLFDSVQPRRHGEQGVVDTALSLLTGGAGDPVQQAVADAHGYVNEVIWGPAELAVLADACDRTTAAVDLAAEHGYTAVEEREISATSRRVCTAADSDGDRLRRVHEALVGLEHYLAGGQGR